ncbi:MAG: AAA family ATPase, partial [Acidiferrobacterales bacterium]
ALADTLGVPFVILDCQASFDTLRQRVRARERDRRDASEANVDVLEQQLATHEPLSEDEKQYAVVLDTTKPLPPSVLPRAMRRGV